MSFLAFRLDSCSVFCPIPFSVLIFLHCFLQLLLSWSVLFSFQITVCYFVTFYNFLSFPFWSFGFTFNLLVAFSLTRFCLFVCFSCDSPQWASGRAMSSSHRPLPDNTQHSQQTDIHAPGGIRTHNLKRWAAADLHLRPRQLRPAHTFLSLCCSFTSVYISCFAFVIISSLYSFWYALSFFGSYSLHILCFAFSFICTLSNFAINNVFIFWVPVCDYALFLHYPNLFLSLHSYLFVCTCHFVFCFLFQFSIRAPLAIDSPFPCLTPTTYIVRGNVSCCPILRREFLPLGVPNVTTSDVMMFRVVHNVFLRCYR